MTIACVTILAPFSIDAYIPAVVDVANGLNSSENLVQVSIAVFLLGFSFLLNLYLAS